MLFVAKKMIGALLLPLPLLLLLAAVGLLLLWFSRRQTLAKILLTGSLGILLLLSLQPVSDHLLAPLENRYPTLEGEHHAAYVVVLGGGYTYNPHWAPGSNLISNSLPRVVEGIRQWRLSPGAKLIFTGARAQDNPRSNASVAAEVARSLGVPAADIIELDKPKDTAEEALAVRKQVGDQPLILVTSANHMPRAMVFFKRAGLSPLPAPANQLAITSPLNFWERFTPSPLWLAHSERAWYETLGRVWQQIRG